MLKSKKGRREQNIRVGYCRGGLKINQSKPNSLEELGDLLNQLNNAVGVTPFVVIPGNQLEECVG